MCQQIHTANAGLLGVVPYELGTLSMLSTVDLHGNRIEGKVPDELCIEETGTEYALKTLIFDCIEPPLVECDCCTPCHHEQGLDHGESSSSEIQETTHAVDYQTIAGDRGVQIAQVLERASSDVKVKGSSASDAAIWLARSDPMKMDPDDGGLLQRWILTMLFYELDGPNWENAKSFLTGESECLWDGITCNTSNKVTQIVLPNNGLLGVIPPELADLDELTKLDLRGNRLEGDVPIDLCDDREISVLVVDCSTVPLIYCACCTPCN
jgi:hypothetical protein